MGMYTELNMAVSLSSDTPERVVETLKFMLGDSEKRVLDDHALFATTRWDIMLRCDSYYFDGRTDSSMIQDDIDHEYKLNIRCNFKNYDNEIELFLNWLQPYMKTFGFIGYTRYEEYDDPYLIYNTYGHGGYRIELRRVICSERV